MSTPEADSVGHFLAIDTSGSAGHVAVGRGPEVLAEARIDRQGRQAAELVPAIRRVLERAQVDATDVKGIVVGEGPGSFTGVRVAAATAKGLATAWNVPLWAVSSLVAAALSEEGSGVRYVLFDARADRVYAACFGVGRSGVSPIVAPQATVLRDVLGGEVPAGAVFLGDGAERHRAAIEGAGFRVLAPPAGEATGRGLLRYTVLEPGRGLVDQVEPWEPAYLKPSSAEREWIA